MAAATVDASRGRPLHPGPRLEPPGPGGARARPRLRPARSARCARRVDDRPCAPARRRACPTRARPIQHRALRPLVHARSAARSPSTSPALFPTDAGGVRRDRPGRDPRPGARSTPRRACRRTRGDRCAAGGPAAGRSRARLPACPALSPAIGARRRASAMRPAVATLRAALPRATTGCMAESGFAEAAAGHQDRVWDQRRPCRGGAAPCPTPLVDAISCGGHAGRRVARTRRGLPSVLASPCPSSARASAVPRPRPRPWRPFERARRDRDPHAPRRLSRRRALRVDRPQPAHERGLLPGGVRLRHRRLDGVHRPRRRPSARSGRSRPSAWRRT